MATRGAKPKPAHLRLVDGTHRNTRHGKKEEVAAAVEATNSIFGALHRPSYLKGEARKAWDRYIAPMTWLDAAREPSAIDRKRVVSGKRGTVGVDRGGRSLIKN